MPTRRGALDALARMLMPHVCARLGEAAKFVVINRPGAATKSAKLRKEEDPRTKKVLGSSTTLASQVNSAVR